MSLLLKNALVFDLQSPHHNKKKDIFIKNGLIEAFNTPPTKAKKVIDCSGMMLAPGFFDLNSDFCDPGGELKEDIASGSKAASSGGFTDVNLVSGAHSVIQSKSDLEYVQAKAGSSVDLHVAAAVSEDLAGENLTEMIDLHVAGAKSFCDGDAAIWNTKLLLKALQYTSSFKAPIFQNARDYHLSEGADMNEGVASTKLGLKGEPGISEELTIQRDLTILRYTGGSIHFSRISTAKAVELIRKARKEGLNVTCDVSIHHLLFTEDDVEDFDSNYKTLPPYRSEKDRKALIKGIAEGVIDAICSGHRPQDQESKQLEFDLADPGTIALQTFFPALQKIKGVPFEVLIERVTAGPRKVLGEDEVRVDVGAPSKLILVDPDFEWVYSRDNNYSKSTNSPFLGQKMIGKVMGTINRECVTLFD